MPAHRLHDTTSCIWTMAPYLSWPFKNRVRCGMARISEERETEVANALVQGCRKMTLDTLIDYLAFSRQISGKPAMPQFEVNGIITCIFGGESERPQRADSKTPRLPGGCAPSPGLRGFCRHPSPQYIYHTCTYTIRPRISCFCQLPSLLSTTE